MTSTAKLIEQVEFLLQLIAGTQAAESQTVIEIYDLIGLVRREEKLNTELTERINQIYSENNRRYRNDLLNLMKIDYPLIELKNPKNPK